ncbi:MAG: histidinol-phosphate transaminase [Planctomycetes bacterium]|nr:histidinol-phosphate transaminase [Planctomycetota bacterium]
MNPDLLVRRSISGRRPPSYPEDDPGFLRMDGNTNLLGQNPAVERVAARAASLELNHYPSAISAALRAELARRHGVPPDQVIVGNGSDELIDFLTKAFVEPGDVVAMPTPTFVMYPFYARVNLARVVEVPLVRPGFDLDVDGLLRAKPKLLFVASPNNPTGNAFPERDLDRLVAEAPGIVVIDEAYADFCGQDYTRNLRSDLVVLRTFSKSFGLAGLRVGYAVGPAALVAKLECVKPPFSVGTFAEAVALEALRDPAFVRGSVETIVRERDRLAEDLKGLGFHPARSDANFLLVEVGDGRGVREFLRGRRILTRDLADFPGLEGFVRFTVGSAEHNDRLLTALSEWKASPSR